MKNALPKAGGIPFRYPGESAAAGTPHRPGAHPGAKGRRPPRKAGNNGRLRTPPAPSARRRYAPPGCRRDRGVPGVSAAMAQRLHAARTAPPPAAARPACRGPRAAAPRAALLPGIFQNCPSAGFPSAMPPAFPPKNCSPIGTGKPVPMGEHISTSGRRRANRPASPPGGNHTARRKRRPHRAGR